MDGNKNKDTGGTNADKFAEETISVEPVFEGKVISLQVETVRLPDGGTSTREVVKHPGAVAVLAVRDGRLLVVEQYRKAMNRSLVEIPAGKLEPGEDPEEAARRELAEETGFVCGELAHVCSFYTSPGFADEIVHLYAASDLRAGQARPDEDEFLEARAVTEEEARAMVLSGEIRDAKTIIALYAWRQFRQSGTHRP